MIMGTIAGLNHFQIEGNGSPNDGVNCQVYKNGRQQIQVGIVIDAYDASGLIIPLTPVQMESVKLIEYDSGNPISSQFSRSNDKDIYDYYPGTSGLASSPDRQNMSTMNFFLSVAPSMNLAALRIAAEITLDGITFITNNRGSAPGGKFDNGGFNSSIVVTPVVPYKLTAKDFQIVEHKGLGWGADPGYTGPATRYLDLWKVTITNTRYLIFASDIGHTKIIHWFSQFRSAGSGLDTCHWALPVLNVGSQVYLGWNRDGGPTTADIFIQPYTKAGEAYAVLERANDFQTHYYTGKPITYIDNHGCEHEVVLRPNHNGTIFQLDNN